MPIEKKVLPKLKVISENFMKINITLISCEYNAIFLKFKFLYNYQSK